MLVPQSSAGQIAQSNGTKGMQAFSTHIFTLGLGELSQTLSSPKAPTGMRPSTEVTGTTRGYLAKLACFIPLCYSSISMIKKPVPSNGVLEPTLI